MAKIKATVQGSRQARLALKEIERSTAKAADAALKKGAAVVVKEMRRRAPKGPTTAARKREGDAKRLKRRIKVTKPKRLRKGEVAAALAKATAPHTHLVEEGTTDRRTKAGKSTGRMKPEPFARPAAEASRSKAVDVIAVEYKARLEAAAAKAAAKAANSAGK